jgi:Flp pilus assembly protein TadG
MPSFNLRFAAAARLMQRFGRNRGGSAAVEFAIVAPIFFALLFAIIETGMVFFAGQVLETANQDAGRLLYTNQCTQTATAALFKQEVCNRVPALMDCAGIYVDVKTYPAGNPVTISDPIDSSGNFINNFTYSAPTCNPSNSSTDTVVVRSFYQWPLYVTGLGYNIANIGRGTTSSKRLLAATAAFRPQ